MKTLLAVLMLTGLMAGAMAASNPALQANIPFDFVVNGKHMPAGDYIITRGDFPGALTITAREGASDERSDGPTPRPL